MDFTKVQQQRLGGFKMIRMRNFLAAAGLALFALVAFAGPLTPAQLATFKAAILAETDPGFVAARVEGNNTNMAIFYNVLASPDYYVWRTSVHEHELTSQTSPEGTNWSWTALIARSLQEQFGYARMFNTSLTINPAMPNVRAGMNDVFSGAANNAPAQRAHLLAMSKRKASRIEKMFATGTGSLGSPATMTFEGSVGGEDIREALAQ